MRQVHPVDVLDERERIGIGVACFSFDRPDRRQACPLMSTPAPLPTDELVAVVYASNDNRLEWT